MNPEKPRDTNLNKSLPLQQADVPVFNCLVYVSPGPDGVRVRMANLTGLECTATGEREALGKIVSAFKLKAAELVRKGAPIPWIDPPLDPVPGEQTRYIPVHL